MLRRRQRTRQVSRQRTTTRRSACLLLCLLTPSPSQSRPRTRRQDAPTGGLHQLCVDRHAAITVGATRAAAARRRRRPQSATASSRRPRRAPASTAPAARVTAPAGRIGAAALLAAGRDRGGRRAPRRQRARNDLALRPVAGREAPPTCEAGTWVGWLMVEYGVCHGAPHTRSAALDSHP